VEKWGVAVEISVEKHERSELDSRVWRNAILSARPRGTRRRETRCNEQSRLQRPPEGNAEGNDTALCPGFGGAVLANQGIEFVCSLDWAAGEPLAWFAASNPVRGSTKTAARPALGRRLKLLLGLKTTE